MVAAQLMCPALTHLQKQPPYLAYYYSPYYSIWPRLVFAVPGTLPRSPFCRCFVWLSEILHCERRLRLAPIWLCLDCEGVAYGWARAQSCIYCGEHRVIGTDDVYSPDENPTRYRLLFFHPRQWAQVEAAATRAHQTPRELLSEREAAPVILICDEPVQDGKLVLFPKPSTDGKAGPGPVEGNTDKNRED